MAVNPYRRSLAGWLSAAQMGTVMALVWAALRLFPLTRVLRWCASGVGAPLVGAPPDVDSSEGRDKPYPYRVGALPAVGAPTDAGVGAPLVGALHAVNSSEGRDKPYPYHAGALPGVGAPTDAGVGAPLVGALPAVETSEGRDKPYPYHAGALPGVGAPESPYARRMAWAAQAVGRRLFGSGPCLVQALALNWFYSRKGIPGRLCIGVAKQSGGRLAAHAWLESGGRVVVGGPEELLAGFVRLPALTQEGQ